MSSFLPGSGSLSLSSLNSEFGKGYSLSNYYSGNLPAHTYDPGVSGSGSISLGSFYGSGITTFQSITYTSSSGITIPSTMVGQMNVYVAAGGGGGGYQSNYWQDDGGYGGHGGIASQSVSVTPGAYYSITVGGGGATGYHGYGYPGDTYADGFGGAGGGGSAALGVYASGGGGGGGGTNGAGGGRGGSSGNFAGGGGGGGWGGSGGAGTGSGNYLGWCGSGYGGGGNPSTVYYCHSYYYSYYCGYNGSCVTQYVQCCGSYYALSPGTQGVVILQGYW